MSADAPPEGHGRRRGRRRPLWYAIRVEGVLDSRWEAWFDGLQVSSEGQETVIAGPLVDQAALHGVLIKVRDLGLSLVAVGRLDRDDA
jgi:hypothetical protein